MSCFFGCFRVKASHSHLTGPRKEVVVSRRSRNDLSSLFLHDDDSAQKDGQSRKQIRDQPHVKMHTDEDVLKAPETLTKTPTEFRNALENSEDESIPCGEAKPIPSLRAEKSNLEMRNECSPTDVKVCGGDSSGSCITDGHSIGRSAINSMHNSNFGDGITPKDVHYAETHSETSSVSLDICAHSAFDLIEMKSEVSLPAFLKPPPSMASKDFSTITGENAPHRRIPSDRPILGMVAAHWKNDEEGPQVPPKWWDGNGIPNSTTKYKEDQKVSWHATPFVERLEKALSEESLNSHMKHSNAASSNVELDEDGETDTAFSR